MNRGLIAAAFCFLAMASAHGEDHGLTHNPFVHPPLAAAASTAVSAADRGRQRPDLRATLVADNASLANVGGKLLAVGEEIYGYRLIRILEGQAVFEKNGEQIVVLVSGGRGSSDD